MSLRQRAFRRAHLLRIEPSRQTFHRRRVNQVHLHQQLQNRVVRYLPALLMEQQFPALHKQHTQLPMVPKMEYTSFDSVS